MGDDMTDDVQDGAKMKMISSVATPAMIRKIDAMQAGSRSDNIRMGVASVLEARRKGAGVFCEKAIHAARMTRLTHRRKHNAAWSKVVVWLPQAMIDDIDQIARTHDLKVPEMVRGIMVWMTGLDPLSNLAPRTAADLGTQAS